MFSETPKSMNTQYKAPIQRNSSHQYKRRQTTGPQSIENNIKLNILGHDTGQQIQMNGEPAFNATVTNDMPSTTTNKQIYKTMNSQRSNVNYTQSMWNKTDTRMAKNKQIKTNRPPSGINNDLKKTGEYNSSQKAGGVGFSLGVSGQ